jgi:dTDP-4-amino-4,6-dideoxygalactose transaminase|tara:strand:- start:610 stop:1716 length:1107 start_codon:yes stop_codon:yes gene_type:complete
MSNWKIPFLDLRITDEDEKKRLMSVINTVFTHGRIVLGPEVEELEKRVASMCNRKYAVGVSSGTDALILGLKSLGIGPGDEVITTSLSWIATANAIAITGAEPVFADIQDDLNIDPNAIKELINSRTKAIMPVHYTGKVCAMTDIMKLADEHELLVIEDASQSFGATYNGKIAGSFGDIGCFSMNPMKIFAACGEAGMAVTDDRETYDRLISLRYNGTVNKEVCIQPSHNGRLDTLQAAILLERSKHLNRIIDRRRTIASLYNDKLTNIVGIPIEKENEYDVYYTYSIQVENRKELIRYLDTCGIETKIQHPILMPHQQPYQNTRCGSISNAERLLMRILCIPVNEKLTVKDAEYVSNCIIEFYKGGH